MPINKKVSGKVERWVEVSSADLTFTSTNFTQTYPEKPFVFCMFLLEEQKFLEILTVVNHLEK